jgi:hypothetical protein
MNPLHALNGTEDSFQLRTRLVFENDADQKIKLQQLIEICLEREEREERKQEREREREREERGEREREREREERKEEREDATKLVRIKENAETDRIRIKHIGTFSSTTVK